VVKAKEPLLKLSDSKGEHVYGFGRAVAKPCKSH